MLFRVVGIGIEISVAFVIMNNSLEHCLQTLGFEMDPFVSSEVVVMSDRNRK